MFPLGYAPNRRGDQAALGVPLTPVKLPATPATWNLAVRVTAPGQTYTVDINAGTNPEIRIDWGDGTVENHVSTGLKTHTYQLVKTHTVKISGRFKTGGNIRLGSNSTDRERLVGTSAIPFIPGLAVFNSTFMNCVNLAHIPEDLFSYNTSLFATGVFYCTFFNCTSLEKIPNNLFRHHSKSGGSNFFYATFYGCTKLKSIPYDLFRYNSGPAFSGFRETFYNCTGLTSLPTDLFRYNTAVSSSGFQSTFQGCTGLTSLPVDLFRYNTAVSSGGFYNAFAYCSGLTSLPADLFRYNTAVSTRGFQSTFYSCSGLTSLPVDLFRYNTAVSTSGFRATFYSCNKLTSLPVDLFRYNTAVSTGGFYNTFASCNKLQLRSDIFFASGEEGTRFLNQSPDFTNCFYLTGAFSGTQGTAPALWSCDFGTGTPIKTDCFQGHSTSSVDNFASIPADWT